MPISLDIPIADETILGLHVGDTVLINGLLMTARDVAHKWLYERFISRTVKATQAEEQTHAQLKNLLQGSLIYHCGPIVSGLDNLDYRFVSAGPTTSMREEPYQADILRHFNLKGVIGKGGMGGKTLAACQQTPAVYFHAVGGAAALIAQSVEQVMGVYKLDFGVPEAIWVIRVKDFPAVVTMDAHGQSLHKNVLDGSRKELERLS